MFIRFHGNKGRKLKYMILYASDLDRTLIFSGRFLKEFPTNVEYTPVETKGERIISYMANSVIEKLKQLNSNDNITFVPVTTRSLEEYNRISLGFTPKYAIVANGGIILHNGEPISEWDEYIARSINKLEAMDIMIDIEDEITAVDYNVKFIDNCYLFFKINDGCEELFDQEVLYLMAKYPNWEFTRQRQKGYAIHKAFSKQVALRWLWRKFDEPYIVASGDSELDLPMLTLANRAIIPTHGNIVREKYVEDGTFADGGITSPLFTMKIVEQEAENRSEE